MPETDKRILQSITATLPKLTDLEKEKLLSFSEGIAFAKDQQESNRKQAEERPA